MKKLFESDLTHLLNTLEKLCQGNRDHIDYVEAYRSFVKKWSPKEKRNLGQDE